MRRLHFLNTQQVEHGSEHADAAANHGAAVVLHAVHFQALGTVRFQQPVNQPVKAIDGNPAARPASGD